MSSAHLRPRGRARGSGLRASTTASRISSRTSTNAEMALLGLRDRVGPGRRAGRPGSRVRGLWLRDSVSSSSMNVDVWDVNEQLQALICSHRAVDAATLVDPDSPLESLVA